MHIHKYEFSALEIQLHSGWAIKVDFQFRFFWPLNANATEN